jgi:hypothetical protein
MTARHRDMADIRDVACHELPMDKNPVKQPTQHPRDRIESNKGREGIYMEDLEQLRSE